MSDILNKRHLDIMEKVLSLKEGVMDKFHKTRMASESLTDEDVDTFVKISNSVENNIDKISKLKLAQAKIETDRQSTLDLVEVFKQFHTQRLEEFQRASEVPVEELIERTEFDAGVIDVELLDGELMLGEDDIDLDGFRKIHGEE